MFFASDNNAPAAPQVLKALSTASEGYAAAYGSDDLTDKVRQKIRDIFEAPEAAVYLVPTGTAANALALATITQPWETIFCHRQAHVEEDECGAPEFFTNGAKITLIDGLNGRMDAEELQNAVNFTGRTGVHNVQRGSLSITSTTETGTVYSIDQIKSLTKIASDAGMKTHFDGARFANALVKLGCTPAEMTWRAGIDVVSFGGTKNGCMGVEAVVLFDPKQAWEFELRRKRSGHLFSKYRYLAAQMDAYLTDDLWLNLAQQANEMADYLAAGISKIKGADFMYPPEANMIFAKWPRHAHANALNAGASYYFWPFNQSLDGPEDEVLSARLVCSWSTTKKEVDQLLDLIS